MSQNLLQHLQAWNLESHYERFKQDGVDLELLSALTLRDFAGFGIIETDDRKNLFQLVKKLKKGDYSLASPPSKQAQLDNLPPIKRQPKTAPTRQQENNFPGTDYTERSAYPVSEEEKGNALKILRPRNNTIATSESQSKVKKVNDGSMRSFSQTSPFKSKMKPPSSGDLGGYSNHSKMKAPSYNEADISDHFEDLKISRNTNVERYNEPSCSDSDSDAGPEITVKHSGNNFTYGVPSATSRKPTGGKASGPRIRVCVRKRPLNKKELSQGQKDTAMIAGEGEINIMEYKKDLVNTQKIEKNVFLFDEVFDEDSTNENVYSRTTQDLVTHIFEKGGKATCIAYGQTGSGKTHTMMGNDRVNGLYIIAARDMFDLIQLGHYNHLSVYASFYEIYCGNLYDLLNKRRKLQAYEGEKKKVHISGLKEIPVNDTGELMDLINCGNLERSTGSTGVNADSSRSHAILQISLKNKKMKEEGKFTFVDLAGSERASDTKNLDKQTKGEGAAINTSLLALQECIRAVDQSLSHAKFRGSKLTIVLRDSLIGNSRTCMIATISPNMNSTQHTLNTLRYAFRVKEMKKATTETSPKRANGTSNSTSSPSIARVNQVSSPVRSRANPVASPTRSRANPVSSPARTRANIVSSESRSRSPIFTPPVSRSRPMSKSSSSFNNNNNINSNNNNNRFNGNNNSTNSSNSSNNSDSNFSSSPWASYTNTELDEEALLRQQQQQRQLRQQQDLQRQQESKQEQQQSSISATENSASGSFNNNLSSSRRGMYGQEIDYMDSDDNSEFPDNNNNIDDDEEMAPEPLYKTAYPFCSPGDAILSSKNTPASFSSGGSSNSRNRNSTAKRDLSNTPGWGRGDDFGKTSPSGNKTPGKLNLDDSFEEYNDFCADTTLSSPKSFSKLGKHAPIRGSPLRGSRSTPLRGIRAPFKSRFQLSQPKTLLSSNRQTPRIQSTRKVPLKEFYNMLKIQENTLLHCLEQETKLYSDFKKGLISLPAFKTSLSKLQDEKIGYIMDLRNEIPKL